LYAAATLVFIFILQLAPSTPGFSRFVGFAVVIHNFAELYLLRRIWFGRDATSFIGVAFLVLYVFFMTTFLAFLPMNGLYLLALIQGATMDYLFCTTLPLIAYKLRGSSWNHKDWLLASVASFFHIASIQPLFIGFSLGNGAITGITTLGLFPTFFFYTYFAGRELGRLGLGPSYKQHLTYAWSVMMLKKVAEVDEELQVEPVTSPLLDNVQQDTVSLTNLYARGGRSLTTAAKEEILHIVTEDDLGADDENLKIARSLAHEGAAKYFNMTPAQIAAPYILAFAFSLLNSLLVWFSPCYGQPECNN